jgi:hypothetical protein
MGDAAATYTYRPTALDEGTYGCVIRPRLPCEDEEEAALAADSAAAAGQVSKVFWASEHADREFELSTEATAADPEGLFSIRPLRKCRVKRTEAALAALQGCEKLDLLSSLALTQLVLPYGGKALDLFMNSCPITDMPHVLRALALLAARFEEVHKRGDAHMDIKASNVLYSAHARVLRFIDFSNAWEAPEYLLEPRYREYNVFPFDWWLLHLVG